MTEENKERKQISPEAENIYDEQISPLMNQLREITDAHNIPFFACFQIAPTAAEKTPIVISVIADPAVEGTEMRMFNSLMRATGN